MTAPERMAASASAPNRLCGYRATIGCVKVLFFRRA
jgi:hypothetical protein